jgi:DNA-binding MarR family transcriptional regulator
MKSEEIQSPGVEETIAAFWKTIPPLWHYTRAAIHRTAREEFGITSTQYHVLRRIKEGKRKTVSELSECMFISRPGISRAVDELANEGLIERERDRKDRRVVYLTPTPAGHKLMEQIYAKNNLFMRKIFSSLDDQELKTINEAFESLQKALNHNTSTEP